MCKITSENACNLCLLIGRNLSKLTSPKLIDYLAGVLGETFITTSKVNLCWECLHEIRRCVAFGDRARKSYGTLKHHGSNIESKVRQPRLAITHLITSTHYSCSENEHLNDNVEGKDIPELKLCELPIEDKKCEDIVWASVDKVKTENSCNLDEMDLFFDTDDSKIVKDLDGKITDSVICPVAVKVKKKKKKRDASDKTKKKLVKKETENDIHWQSVEEFDNYEENSRLDDKDAFHSEDSISLLELDGKSKTELPVRVKEKKKKKKDSVSKKKKVKDSFKMSKRKKAVEKMRIIELTQDDLEAEREGYMKKETYIAAEYKCESCIVGFSYVNSYEEHMRSRHNKEKGEYVCPICETVSSNLESFTTHYRRHLTRYECVQCGKQTSDRKSMNQHYLTTHEDNATKEYKCHCGKISCTPDAHRYHKGTHKARVECDQCDKTFSHRAGLMNHRMFVHKRNNPFACDKCDKVFRWKASLKKHAEKHDRKTRQLDDRPRCEPCGISFSSVCTYRRHMKSSLKHVTENQLRFVCADCNRKFSNKTKLRDHIEEKHLHKTYQCHICLKPSKNRVCLDQHIRNIHRGRRNDKMCHHCGKGFPTKVQLESHIRSHTGERPFICELCPTTFSQQSNLYKHTRQVHLNLKSKRSDLARRRKDLKIPSSVQQTHVIYPLTGHETVYRLMA